MTRAPTNWAQRLAVVSEIGQTVNASLDLDVTLNSMMASLKSLIDYTAAEISLWHETREAMVVCAQAGDPRYTRQAEGMYQLDEGYAGWIARHRKPLLIEDTLEFKDIQPRVVDVQKPIRSFLGVPLEAGDVQFGTMEMVSHRPRAFHYDDQEILQIIGQYAVTAIKNSQLLTAEKLRAEHFAAIHQVSTAANSTLDSSEIFRRVLVEMLKVFNLDQGSVILFDHEGGYGYPLIEYPPPPRFKGPTSPIPLSGHSLAETVLTYKRPIAIEDARQDIRLAAMRAATGVWQIKSLLLVPLVIKEKVLGTINLYGVRSTRRFSEDELELAATMANQVSTAIDNAQLYEQLAKRISVLNTLYEAGRVVISSLELDEILRRLAEQAWHLTVYRGKKISAAGIRLVEGTMVRLAAVYPPGDISSAGVELSPDLDLAHADESSLGAVGQAIKTGAPQLVGCVSQDQSVRDSQPRARSVLAVPIKLGDEVVGAIQVEHSDYNAFDHDDQHALEYLAAQAAIAIQNARRYESEQQRVKEFSGLNKISQAIGSLTDIHQVYQLINMSIAELAGAEMCAILLYEETRQALVCQLPAYGVPDHLGRQYIIPLQPDSLTYALWKMRGHLILNNAADSPLMTELGLAGLAESAKVRDTLLIKLTAGNRDVGIIQASNKLDRTPFDEDDARLLSIFAGQAAAVIENARLYEALNQAQGVASARTGLAWMGMANSAWRHAVDKHALTIREQTQLLRRNLQKLLPDEHYARLEDRLTLIERVAGKILEKPLTLPLSAEAGIESVEVNGLVNERANQLWQNYPYKLVQLQLDLTALPSTATVRVSPEWLRRAFDILVDNAVNATADCETQIIRIGTRAARNQAEIFVSDNGPGLPPHIMDKIGLEFIEKPEDSKGLGMGLLMGQTIVQTYGGEIRVDSTGPTGTTMIIALPLEKYQVSS